MRLTAGKLIILFILSVFLYRNRFQLLRLVAGMAFIRRLLVPLNFTFFDTRRWLRRRLDDFLGAFD